MEAEGKVPYDKAAYDIWDEAEKVALQACFEDYTPMITSALIYKIEPMMDWSNKK